MPKKNLEYSRSKICLEMEEEKKSPCMYTLMKVHIHSIKAHIHGNNLYQLPRKLSLPMISFSYHLCMNDSLIPISDCAPRLNHISISS